MGTSRMYNRGVTGSPRDPGYRVTEADSDVPTFTVSFSVALTAAKDIVSLVAGANKVLRLRKVVVANVGTATAAQKAELELGTAAAVGSGGAAGTVRPLDAQARVIGQEGGPDVTTGIVARVGDSTQAASFVGTHSPLASLAIPATSETPGDPKVLYEWKPGVKPLTTAGDTVPIVLRSAIAGAGAANFRGYVEFTVDDA